MKRVLLVVSIVFAGVMVYYAAEVLTARSVTPGLLKHYLGNAVIELEPAALTPRRLDILLKVEDPGFYTHKGVDLVTPGAGLTTITQSIVKKMYFKDFKPGLAKIRQTLIARFVVHPLVSKEDQMRIFINTLWFDKGVVGMRAGARHFFGKDITVISEDQYISLVAMIIAPVTFNIQKNPHSNKERSARITRLIAGTYRPRGLMDQYYGPLTEKELRGTAPASYVEYR